MLQEMMDLGDPAKFTTLDQNVRLQMFKDSWEDFMSGNNVRMGVPNRLDPTKSI